MAGVRNVRTKEQKINDLKAKLAKVKSDMRDETKKADDRRAIIIGKSLQDRASRDKDAKQLLDAIIAGLVRDQDRKMFDLDPLPKADQGQGQGADASLAAKPSAADIAAATARYEAARRAFNEGRETVESGRLQAAFVEATIVLERLTGSLVGGITPENRKGFGLGGRPGERLKNG
jgi:hypothetical protein